MRRREGWHTVAETAELIGVSRATVYRDIREGRLRAVMPRLKGRGLLVSDAELDRYFAEEFVPTAPRPCTTG